MAAAQNGHFMVGQLLISAKAKLDLKDNVRARCSLRKISGIFGVAFGF